MTPEAVLTSRQCRHQNEASGSPDGRHREAMDTPNLGKRKQLSLRPLARFDPLAEDPVGGCGIPADLTVLAELLVSDCAAFGQEELNLLERQRIALDGCRVVRLL